MKKRIFSIFVALMICISSSFVMVASAQSTNNQFITSLVDSYQDNVQLRWHYTSSCSASLNFSGSTAYCYATCTGYPDVTTYIDSFMYLQKMDEDGDFRNVDEAFRASTSNWYLSYSDYMSGLSSGTYRIQAFFVVYSDECYEAIITYSSTKTI